jgi:hypothetical protein
MPQPALHVLIGTDLLQQWRRGTRIAPFDPTDPALANAFLVGCLAPDLGLFPGGSAAVSRLAHTVRTGELMRELFRRARSERQLAFAWGWLSHLTADVAIHPLVNHTAAEVASRRGTCSTIADHVRVEVGLDAWLAWRNPRLQSLGLAPALRRYDWLFVTEAYAAVHGHTVTATQLLQMQRGLVRFTRLAVHFATVAARHLCWNEPAAADQVPAATALLWRVVTLLSSPQTVAHAYLNPAPPAPELVARVQRGMDASMAEFDRYRNDGLAALPDFNLETGSLLEAERDVA